MVKLTERAVLCLETAAWYLAIFSLVDIDSNTRSGTVTPKAEEIITLNASTVVILQWTQMKTVASFNKNNKWLLFSLKLSSWSSCGTYRCVAWNNTAQMRDDNSFNSVYCITSTDIYKTSAHYCVCICVCLSLPPCWSMSSDEVLRSVVLPACKSKMIGGIRGPVHITAINSHVHQPCFLS